MTNIWGFLVQTTEVTVMAGVILFLKTLMKDKLSPRWQYGVWLCLGISVLVPAGINNSYIFPYLQVCIQACKTLVEQNLASRFTMSDRVVQNSSVFPVLTGKPVSITDMLFIAYIGGIALFLAKYLFNYFRLQKIILSAVDADATTAAQINTISQKYRLQPSRAKMVPGLTSAFVFGVVKPVLVLPADKETDDKVILHELLHLKHRDLWQKLAWSLLRTLHWPNILLQFCFGIINNDMESLCDQRVLELLQGEERRDYGRILLSMTNDKYPSAFGTTSISNGGDFIAKRIKNIARFKKYPQGVGVVSVCIVFMMLPLVGNAGNRPEKIKHINTAKQGIEYQIQYEQYRMAQCSTPAAAIDAYAKALEFEMEEFMLAIQPQGIATENYSLPDFNEISDFESGILYFVTDIKYIDENTCTAGLMFKDFYHGSDDDYGTNYYIIPVTMVKQQGWKLYQSGDYSHHYLDKVIDNTYSPPTTDDYKGGIQIKYDTEYGTLKLIANNISYNNTVDNSCYLYPDTDFSSSRTDITARFTASEKCLEYPNIAVSMSTITGPDDTAEQTDVWMSESSALSEWGGSSGGPDGLSAITNVPIDRLFGRYERKIYADISHDSRDFTIPDWLQLDIWGGTEIIKTLKIDVKAGEVYE